MRKRIIWLLAAMTAFAAVACTQEPIAMERRHYTEVSHPTPNIEPDTLNEMLGVILHHTALPTVEDALRELTRPNGVSSHVVIDTDGTRYVLAPPTAITFHAGLSFLNGRERCNTFCIGVEFQGNTAQFPLTEEQIESGVEYLLPIITEQHIPLDNIVTHKMVRDNYIHQHPEKRCKNKVDISSSEYARFMDALKTSLDSLQALSE